MARTKQHLINYNTTDATRMPGAEEVSLGEIVVRNSETKPELLIKAGEGFAVFEASGAVRSAINSVSDKVTELSGATDARFETTDTVIEENERTTSEALNNLNNRVTEVSGHTATLETKVAAIEGETGDVATKIEEAAAAAVSSAKTYTDTVKTELQGNIDSLTSATGALQTKITEVSGSVTAFSAAVISDITTVKGDITSLQEAKHTHENKTELDLVKSGDVAKWDAMEGNAKAYTDAASGAIIADYTQKINEVTTKVSKAYHFVGSVATKASLPTGATEGAVYNVQQADGTPGEPDYVPAGTNYAWNGTEWDALGGTVDLSAYAKTSYVDGKVSELSERISGLDTRLTTAEGNIQTLSGASHTHANKAVLDTVTQNTVNNAASAATSIEIADSEGVTGITASLENNKITLNFDNLVIDCGEF